MNFFSKLFEKSPNTGADRTTLSPQNTERDNALFFEAIAQGDIQQIKMFIERGYKINKKHHLLGSTPLIWASMKKQTRIIQLLLDKGADVNAVDSFGSTSLIWVSGLPGDSTEIAKLLLDAGADVNAVDKWGRTVLINASSSKDAINPGIVKLLIKSGADIDVVGQDGNTALMGASERGYTEIVKILKECDSKVSGEHSSLCNLSSSTSHQPSDADNLIHQLKYFEVPSEVSKFLCSDNQCPCPGTEHLVLGETGYLYISNEVVDMRKDALTKADLDAKQQRIINKTDASLMYFDQGTVYPIVMCKEGVRLRKLDLNVAAADARHWRKTGLVPLRVTPKLC
ncbi:ankyrin repeat domain-containing protein [Thermodesulfobacteriota bacterium]